MKTAPSLKGYEFPIVSASLRKLCSKGFSVNHDLQRMLIGQTYFFNSAEVYKWAAESNRSIDHMLTFSLAKGFQAQKPLTPVLIWFYAVSGGIYLFVGGNKGTTSTSWLCKLPGFEETGEDYIEGGATPFFYWDGKYGHRVFQIPDEDLDAPALIQDFGSLVGVTLMRSSPEEFERINNDPIEYPDYSAIPRTCELHLGLKGEHVAVMQARIELTDNPLEDPSW